MKNSLLFLLLLIIPLQGQSQSKARWEKDIHALIVEAEGGKMETMKVLADLYARYDIPGTNHKKENFLHDDKKSEFWRHRYEYFAQGAAYNDIDDEFKALFEKQDILNKGKYSNFWGENAYQYAHENEKAQQYLQKATERGSIRALYNMGLIFQHGYRNKQNEQLTLPSMPTAMSYFQRAADAGEPDAIAKLVVMKDALDRPFDRAGAAFGEKNYAEAFRLWKIDAEENDSMVSAYNVGTMYENGYGMAKNPDIALMWYEMSGRMGYGKGSFYAGNLYNLGGYRGSAIEWWQKAVTQGYTDAQYPIDQIRGDIKSDIARRQAESEANTTRMNQNNNSSTSYTTEGASAITKTCPICNGTGKISSHETFTDGKVDNNNVTQYGQTTTTKCSRCNGTGRIE